MLQVLLPKEARFKQLIDRQEKISNILIFQCTKNGICIIAMNPILDCAAMIDFTASGFENYTCPDSTVIFAVERFELTEAMRKSKENHGNSILLTIENVDRMENLLLDFMGGQTEELKQMPVKILTKYPKYKMNFNAMPDYRQASTYTTNSKMFNRDLTILTFFTDKRIEMRLDKDGLTMKVKTPSGIGSTEYTHGFDYEEYKTYSERDVFAQCPKQFVDFSTVKMNPEHGPVVIKYPQIAALVAHEQPTTNSSRVEIGLTPNACLYIYYKLQDIGSYTFIADGVFAPIVDEDDEADALSE